MYPASFIGPWCTLIYKKQLLPVRGLLLLSSSTQKQICSCLAWAHHTQDVGVALGAFIKQQAVQQVAMKSIQTFFYTGGWQQLLLECVIKYSCIWDVWCANQYDVL